VTRDAYREATRISSSRTAACRLGNAWAMRGRHFGWVALSAVAGLAVAGY
jgi:hypothetical protein